MQLCRWDDNHGCVGKDWAESWVVPCFHKSCEKHTEECDTGSVVSCYLYLWKTAGMNEWLKSGAGARRANWNSGRLTGGLVSRDMKYKKTNFVLSCVSAAPWLAGSLLGVCECVCVWVCAPGVMNLSHTICLVPSTLFSPVHSALRVVWGLSWQCFV